MGIGQRKQIQLVKMISVASATGAWQEPTEQKYGCWAEISNPSGFREYNSQTQLSNTRRFLVRFRFDKHPGADWKIRYEGFDWTIQGVIPVNEKRFYWSITAEKISDV